MLLPSLEKVIIKENLKNTNFTTRKIPKDLVSRMFLTNDDIVWRLLLMRFHTTIISSRSSSWETALVNKVYWVIVRNMALILNYRGCPAVLCLLNL